LHLFSGFFASSTEVAYQSQGRSRSLLEAAAARGFAHVSNHLLDTILDDMEAPRGVNQRISKVSRIIEHWKGQWGWSQVDVARALVHIMPGAKPQAARRPNPQSNSGEFVWDDLPSIAAALEAHTLDTALCSKVPAVASPPDAAVLETLLQMQVPTRESSAAPVKRASAHFAPEAPHPFILQRNRHYQISILVCQIASSQIIGSFCRILFFFALEILDIRNVGGSILGRFENHFHS
jgi:hypothetical protein